MANVQRASSPLQFAGGLAFALALVAALAFAAGLAAEGVAAAGVSGLAAAGTMAAGAGMFAGRTESMRIWPAVPSVMGVAPAGMPFCCSR